MSEIILSSLLVCIASWCRLRKHEWSKHSEILIQVIFMRMQSSMIVLQRSHLYASILADAHLERMKLIWVGHLHYNWIDRLIKAIWNNLHTFVKADIMVINCKLSLQVCHKLLFLLFIHIWLWKELVNALAVEGRLVAFFNLHIFILLYKNKKKI